MNQSAIKIYAVSSGCYSDYSVNALFSTRENAEGYIRTFYSGKDSEVNEIEEYELDSGIEHVKPGHIMWYVHMTREGLAQEVKPVGCPCGNSIGLSKYGEWVRPAKGEGFDYKKHYVNKGMRLFGYVIAKDETHAVKIVNEKRTQLIASGEWEVFNELERE